jgi:hypothetical protein
MDSIETRTVEHEGYTVALTAYHDQDSNPLDYAEEYEDVVKQWRDGSLIYVGIVARVVTDDGLEGPESMGIWGCEYGYNGDTDYPFMSDYAQEEIAQAVELFKASIEKLCAA